MRIEQSQVQLSARSSSTRMHIRAEPAQAKPAAHSRRGADHSRHSDRQRPSAPPTTQNGGFEAGDDHVAFEAHGTVQTADGRQIDFQDQLELSNQFVHTAGTAADQPPASPDSGVLFIDKNGDGVANDASEILGAQSKDGFADLARQDSDGNGWIDQGDPLFNQIRVSVPGGSYSLADLGIGAIYTRSVATPFGHVGSTGIYLTENGSVGVLQQTDLAGVTPPSA